MAIWAAAVNITRIMVAWAIKVDTTVIMADIMEAVVIMADTITGRISKVVPAISSRHHHHKCGCRNNNQIIKINSNSSRRHRMLRLV